MSLSERLQQIKLNQTPFKLSTFLSICVKADKSASMQYHKGALALYLWLTNEGKVPLVVDSDVKIYKLPNILLSWDLSELATIVESNGKTAKASIVKHNKTVDEIYSTLLQKVFHHDIRD